MTAVIETDIPTTRVPPHDDAAEHLEITSAAAARATAIDHVPDGTPLPEPKLRVVPPMFDENGIQAVPSLHPMFDEQRRAA